MENKEIYGNQCGSDNAFTRKARLLQSMYRVEVGEEEGVGPTRASKRKYGNMISGGEASGKNFKPADGFQSVPSPDVTVEAGSGNGYACREVSLQELSGI